MCRGHALARAFAACVHHNIYAMVAGSRMQAAASTASTAREISVKVS